MSRIVYSPAYDIGFFGLERLHPFDARKFSRAWKRLRERLGDALQTWHARPSAEVSRETLESVHSPAYLDSLARSATAAAALELAPLRFLPGFLVDRIVLRAMRWATQGTVEAAGLALDHGFAVNLGGGYHHAKPTAGEGFCLYNDIALAVVQLRAAGRLAADATVLYIDLDAHQGNGVCYAFRDDRSVQLFDMYNGSLYPATDAPAQARIDVDLPLPMGCSGERYLGILREALPDFLAAHPTAALAIYNAGTDVFCEDALGGMELSAADVLARDTFTVGAVRDAGLPCVMLLSGGYSQASYRLVADSVAPLLEAG